jgi:hypothetical protein
MQQVLCENILEIPELDARGEVINISQDRSKIGILGSDGEEWYNIRDNDGTVEIYYNHKYGTPGYEKVAEDVSLDLISCSGGGNEN